MDGLGLVAPRQESDTYKSGRVRIDSSGDCSCINSSIVPEIVDVAGTKLCSVNDGDL
jgi:hypothetical protein